jgi:hypothetical protein
VGSLFSLRATTADEQMKKLSSRNNFLVYLCLATFQSEKHKKINGLFLALCCPFFIELINKKLFKDVAV